MKRQQKGAELLPPGLPWLNGSRCRHSSGSTGEQLLCCARSNARTAAGMPHWSPVMIAVHSRATSAAGGGKDGAEGELGTSWGSLWHRRGSGGAWAGTALHWLHLLPL